jgi:L-lactate permease
VTFPLLFVRGATRHLPLLAVLALVVHVGVEWIAREAFGLSGVAVGMGVTTAVVLVALLRPLESLGETLRGLLVAALVCGGLAALAFAAPGAVLEALPAALVGLAVYATALLVWRPSGLRAAWTYARVLR